MIKILSAKHHNMQWHEENYVCRVWRHTLIIFIHVFRALACSVRYPICWEVRANTISGFAPGFVNYTKGCTRLAAASHKVDQLLAHGRWFSPGIPASSTTGRHDIVEILLKVALNTKNQIKSTNKISLYSPLSILLKWLMSSQERERSCICVLGVLIFWCISITFQLYFETLPIVWYYLYYFHFIVTENCLDNGMILI